jgi:hypothetical protein
MKILLMLIAFSLLSFGAHAEVTGAKVCLDGKHCGDLAGINEACQNPGAYNHQNPPTDIKIGCAVLDLRWRMGKPGTINLYGLKTVTAGLMSDKAGVFLADVDFTFPRTPMQFPCPNFVNTRGTGAMEFAVTCQDIAGMHSAGTSLIDFCNQNMLNEVEADEELMVVVPTGKTWSGCGNGGGHGQH